MKRIKKIFQGVIVDGKLQINNHQGLLDYIKTLSSEKEQKVDITIEKHVKKRTNKQNDYYWGVVIQIISDELGYTPQETHEAIKYELLRINGVVLDKFLDTKLMNTVEFNDYIEKIKIWTSDKLSIYIPDPNEINY